MAFIFYIFFELIVELAYITDDEYKYTKNKQICCK